METIRIAPCAAQDAGLAAHPLCLMRPQVDRAPERRAGMFSYALTGGSYAPKHTNRKRSS
jgi:hypothetical protein